MVETRGGRRFAVFFLVAAFMVLLVGRWVRPIGNMALTVSAPFAAVISGTASSAGDMVSGIVDGPGLRSDNHALQKKVATLLRANILLQEQAKENRLFRSMLNFDDANNRMELLTANVIGNDPNSPSQYIIINRGTRDGLRVGMTVLDQNGFFVGKIADLTYNATRVLLMLSPSSSVGAIDLKTRAKGVVEGQYGARPQLKFVLSSASLHRGDFVVTSGDYNLFPRTLLLGQVVAVHHSAVEMLQRADIQPAADFQNLEMVQVVRNYAPSVPAKWISSP